MARSVSDARYAHRARRGHHREGRRESAQRAAGARAVAQTRDARYAPRARHDPGRPRARRSRSRALARALHTTRAAGAAEVAGVDPALRRSRTHRCRGDRGLARCRRRLGRFHHRVLLTRAAAAAQLRHGADARRSRRLDRETGRGASRVLRHGDRPARRHSRPPGRSIVCDCARRGGVRAARARLSGGARAARSGSDAAGVAAAARERSATQARASAQARRAHSRGPRHRAARAALRFHARVLCARQRRDGPRHGLHR